VLVTELNMFVLVVRALRPHPFPSRTRKWNVLALTILGVSSGRRRTTCQMTGVSKSRTAVAKVWGN